MLKDYMEVIAPEARLENLDIDELIKESGLVVEKIQLANKILGCIESDENITKETATALLLPLYDYDVEYFNTENAQVDAMYQNAAVSASFTTKIIEIIKKLFRIFYNMFKELQAKLVAWLHGIQPYIVKLETKIDNTDFSKVEKFDEKDNERLLNCIGVYSLFTGKLSDETVPRIITSFKNMKDIIGALEGYDSFISGLSKNLLESKSAADIDENKFIASSEDSLTKMFFEKLPKFYKDISGQLKTFASNKSIKTSINLDRVHTSYVVSTNGTDLNIIYTLGNDGLINTICLRHGSGSIITDKFIKDVSINPLDSNKMGMLIKSIKENDITKLSDSVRAEFKKLESNMDKIMNSMSHTEFNRGEINLIGQVSRAVFSDNLSFLNTICFNYINHNAKLMVNTLKLIEISLSKYEPKQQSTVDGQKLLK